MLFSCCLSIYGTNVRKEKDLKNQYTLILDSVYEAIENELGKPIYTSITMSNNVFLKDLLLEEEQLSEEDFVMQATRYLSTIQKETDAQTAFLISDYTRKYYTHSGVNKVINPAADEHDIWYSTFINSRKKYDLDVDIDQTNNNQWTVFVNTRIESETGKLLGVCGIGLSMDIIQEVLKHYESTYDVKVNFIDSDGTVQIDTDNINIEQTHLNDIQYGKEKDGYSYINQNNEYVVMRFVDNLNWYLVIHGNVESIRFDDIQSIVFGTSFMIILNLAFMFLITRKKKTKTSN